ncbi:T9SS type A sorting domain-containing protein [Larkinella rosea]|uniref:T9SS C-terminal target domain-containing protein n=1 Tax=Larkinella rosea TaxID=2025312 RepID=A0A3P1BFJ6_9BACT|nr:T9SS type A sorting domain-containing protein [Larkinella rosea]RRA99830.1 T9SS C-terminal target domain-containing protein [Larkinella rosea]
MKYGFLLSAGLMALMRVTSSLAQDLKFDTTTPLYPAGAATHSYTGIGTPAVNVTLNINGPGTASIPSPERASTGLSTPNWKFNNSSESRNYTFTFGDPVTGLEFALNALQYKTFTITDHNYQDKITIIATDEFGNSVVPVIPAGTGYSVNGNEIVATSGTASNVNKVFFPTKVKTVQIIYGNGPLAGPFPNGQGFTIGNMEWTGIVLPVDIAYFRAKPIGSVVQLSWETVSEQNADYFLVEHGLDLENLKPIGRVKATGNTARRQTYSFVDDQSHRMINYYRLQQVDKDGSKRYSKTISVQHDGSLPALTVYPNPSDGQSIGLQFNELDAKSLQLTDLNQRKIEFSMVEQTSGQVTLKPVSPLKTGLYFLHATGLKATRFLVN